MQNLTLGTFLATLMKNPGVSDGADKMHSTVTKTMKAKTNFMFASSSAAAESQTD